ncbi:MAG: septation regulator SpoVG [Oscillospiraceae bacterium]|nr:septation regulator SpoVG [Oscillospiraceae bacterium]
MEITDIKIRKIVTEGRLRAVVSITVDHMLAVHDIKIVQGDERLFIAMPSRKDENGVFRDIVHPILPEARKMIEEGIIETYQKHLALTELEAQEAAKAAASAEPAEPAASAEG